MVISYLIMRLKFIIPIIIVAIVVAAIIYLSGGSRIVVKGDIVTCDEMTIYLYSSESAGEPRLIDSMRLSNRGKFRFSFDHHGDDHAFYELVCGWESIPLLLCRGDRVAIESAGSLSLNYNVSGSEDSELLKSFFQPYTKGARELRDIANRYAVAQYKNESTTDLALEYNSKYREIKQAQMRYIVENKEHIVSLFALAQRLPGDEFIFEERSDLIYMRMVAEGIEPNYSSSPYLSVLKGDIERAEQRLNLNEE